MGGYFVNIKELLKNIGGRTNGDIYLGVVGPVRTGKSTFIKRFMELVVINNIQDEYQKARATDELPQSGQGKTIMTTEPKFVPNNAVSVEVGENLSVQVRLVDCVGYVFKDAKGYMDEDKIRMVKTPWFEDAIPFDEAAKIGTQKVITDHCSIGIVVTTDGTIVDIPRNSYVEAEDEVITQLQTIGKPFIVIVNSKDPNGVLAQQTAKELSEKYQVSAIPMSIEQMNQEDANQVLKDALYEFPVLDVDVVFPSWVAALDENYWLKQSYRQSIQDALQEAKKVRDVEKLAEALRQNEYAKSVEITNIDTATGVVTLRIEPKDGLYEAVINDIVGTDLQDKADLIKILQEYKQYKEQMADLLPAILMAKETGYGSSVPSLNDISISKPELIKNGNRYGVRIKASAPTLHIFRVDVENTFEPILGSKEQSEAMMEYLTQNEETLVNMSMFGRNIGDLLKDGINAKLMTLPENNRIKLQNILKSMTNRGKNNLIAIVF